MNKLITLLFITFGTILSAQIRPDLMPTKSPASTDAIYTQEDGALKKVLFSAAKDYFNTDDQQLTTFSLDPATNILTITLEDGGTKTVDLSGLSTGTDDQKITDFSLAGNIITLTLEDGGTKTVDLSGLSHTGTAGSVFFADNDGQPTEDNANLFWDSANKRLGVGITTPSEKMEVNGAIKLGNNGGGVSIFFQSGKSIRERNSTQNSVMFLDMGDIRIRDGNAFPYGAGLSVGGNKFVVKNNATGFVGIGTTSPSEKLEINGSVKIGDAIKFTNNRIEENGGVLSLHPIGSAEGIGIYSTGNVAINNLQCSSTLKINNIKTNNFATGIGAVGDVMIAHTVSSDGNTLRWTRLRPTIGNGTGNVYVIASSSFTYAIQLSDGEIGYAENTTTGSITVTAPAGVSFINHMTSSNTLVLDGHTTATFIRDHSDNYRVISIW